MKKIIIGLSIIVISSIYFCTTEKYFGPFLLVISFGLFLMLRGYLKLMEKLIEDEENERR